MNILKTLTSRKKTFSQRYDNLDHEDDKNINLLIENKEMNNDSDTEALIEVEEKHKKQKFSDLEETCKSQN